jgi:hypothetical protein
MTSARMNAKNTSGMGYTTVVIVAALPAPWAGVTQGSVVFLDGYEGPPLFVNSDAFVNIVMPALTLQNNDGPPLFVNSDAFVNTACLHTHVPLECSWYDSHQHWWCVRFECSAALLSVLHQCLRCSQTPMAPGMTRMLRSYRLSKSTMSSVRFQPRLLCSLITPTSTTPT